MDGSEQPTRYLNRLEPTTKKACFLISNALGEKIRKQENKAFGLFFSELS